MVLNFIWVGFFIIAFIIGLYKLIVLQDVLIFEQMMTALFERSKLGFEISIGLTGVLALWMGIMKIGEKGGAVQLLVRAVTPLFKKLFPTIPENHPAIGAIMLNFSANMLGLDNAATPMGLKAMEELQKINPKKDTASNEQILFLVLNTSGLTIIPVSILAQQLIFKAENPTDIFIPILLATTISTLVGLIATCIVQKINLFNKTVLLYLGGLLLLITIVIVLLSSWESKQVEVFSKITANLILFSVIIFFILLGILRKVNVYAVFIEGAKDGFNIAVKIIPYLIAMLAAIGVFTASGAMNYFTDLIKMGVSFIGFSTDFVDALPTAIMKPLSGGGARALMLESWNVHGVDSFVGKLTAVMQGSTETTFYVLAVYFGSVGIKNIRYAATLGLLADLAGVIAAIYLCYLFF